MTAIPSTLIY